ncbi:hypothetical protein A2153_01535 [Candidatus Gottesmanbacteria bacterium RBG_16_38_7b]|uniref:DUF5678 domain-containing protein n=1 Tax=Candidatus Gottesmanbacteria bacterium RBG_16_38_7b TaxID=1798372 RepID=A0A1F5YF81_9BACT|nr:MAG: hypothetical protein A2153_01535 [Candidatus Gottesmanbacteria bacterium RBG_16_38_7b]
MTKKKIDFVKLLKNYQKKGWVAISHDFNRVLFYGKTLKETVKKAKFSRNKIYYFPTGEKYSRFVGYIR